jgi:choline dehydrogenase-like flavoprotein
LTSSNLLISDGSVLCPTQGSANPALTIMALASRLAGRMAGGAAMDNDPAARAGRTCTLTGSRR